MANNPLNELKMTQVADLVYKQIPEDEMMATLGMDRASVRRYKVALRAEWAEHRMQTAEEYFDEQLVRLAYLERHLMPAIERGYVPAFDRMLLLYDQRNKLLGLYAPTKSETDIGEQLAKLLTKIAVEPEPDYPQLPAPQISIEGEARDVSDV